MKVKILYAPKADGLVTHGYKVGEAYEFDAEVAQALLATGAWETLAVKPTGGTGNNKGGGE
jgi:hypothetical protein